MSSRTETIYICDSCGVETDYQTVLDHWSVLTVKLDGHNARAPDEQDYDLCDNCTRPWKSLVDGRKKTLPAMELRA